MYADSENNFKGLFYHDEKMRNMFSAYPEIVFIDATCKLNDLRLPLYVMMFVHGNGESEIVGLMYMTERQVLQDELPQAGISICLFHPMCSFHKEVMGNGNIKR